MKCKKCNSEVLISDSKCPKCGNDLHQFGSTIFYEPKERDGLRSSQTIKGMVIQELSKDIREGLENLDPWERKIFIPIESRLRTLLAQHISDSEIENIFENEIVPTVDGLSKDKATEKVFKKVEEEIKNNLGYIVYNHYKNKREDVLKILRAGEIACILIRETPENIDLSIKMFPFFKASEVACYWHIHDRYRKLKNDPIVKDIADWIGSNVDNVYIENVPKWIAERKKTLKEIINGILTENEYYLNGSLRTGISLYILGREWILKIERKDLSKTKEFQVRNALQAKGSNEDRESLAKSLNNIQDLRNERVHKDVEDNEQMVRTSRVLSYNCLKEIPIILEI